MSDDIKNKLLFDEGVNGRFRYNDEQLKEQRDELVVYVLTELSTDDVNSIKDGINAIKEITGYEITLEEALKIRKEANEKKGIIGKLK